MGIDHITRVVSNPTFLVFPSLMFLTAEFAPHLRWLATDPEHDAANCKCIACRQGSKSSGTPRKRSIESVSPTTPTRVLRRRPSIEKKAEAPVKKTTGRKVAVAGEKIQGKKAKEAGEEDKVEERGEEEVTGNKEGVDATSVAGGNENGKGPDTITTTA